MYFYSFYLAATFLLEFGRHISLSFIRNYPPIFTTGVSIVIFNLKLLYISLKLVIKTALDNKTCPAIAIAYPEVVFWSQESLVALLLAEVGIECYMILTFSHDLIYPRKST